LAGLLLYSVFVRPRNLIFVRDTDYGNSQKAWLNARTILRLHTVWDLALALEMWVWILFSAAMILLAISVTV
jgi:hypothetical protein